MGLKDKLECSVDRKINNKILQAPTLFTFSGICINLNTHVFDLLEHITMQSTDFKKNKQRTLWAGMVVIILREEGMGLASRIWWDFG